MVMDEQSITYSPAPSWPGPKGRTRWYGGGGGYGFFPLYKLLFSLLTRNKPYFSAHADKGTSKLFPYITPLFCQFCEQTFYF